MVPLGCFVLHISFELWILRGKFYLEDVRDISFGRWKLDWRREKRRLLTFHLYFVNIPNRNGCNKLKQVMKGKFKWSLTGNISLGVQNSKDVEVECHPTSRGDRYLFCRTWRLCMVLSMWALIFPRLGLLWRESPFLVLGPPLRIPCVLLVDHNNEPFFVGMPSSSLQLDHELRPTGPDSIAVDCRYSFRHICLFWNWSIQFPLEWQLRSQTSNETEFLLWGFLLSSCMPIGHLGALPTIIPLPPQVESW